jgi:hypothetical protein
MNNFHETLINQLAKEGSFITDDEDNKISEYDKHLTREFYGIKDEQEAVQIKLYL